MKIHRALIVVGGGWAALTSTTNAQTASTHQDETMGVLQEVVVTAQKRSESILSVPISITALSQATLENQGIKDIYDIARATPSLNIGANNGFGYSNVSIRGVTSTTGAATTGIYIDDSPIEQRIDSLAPPLVPQLFDLNRVEVLRGPQGTLFGSGSEGGTIRFITPAPSTTESSVRSRAEFAYTDRGAPTYEAGVAGGAPLVDGQLGFRASLWYRDQGGYIDRVNRYTGQLMVPNSNGVITQAARFSLGWQPIDALTITPTVIFQHVHQKDANFFWEERPDFQSEAKIAAPDDDKWTLSSLTADYSLPAVTIRSISSYLSRRNFQINDWSYIEPSQLQGGPVDVPGLPNWNAGIHANVDQAVFTQELRFTSVDTSVGDSKSPFSWVGGLYFQHNRLHRVRNEFEDLDALTNAIFGAPAIAIFGSAPLPGPVGYAENTTQIEQESAAFGNVTYRLTDALKLTAGVRVARSRFSNSTFQDGPWNAGPSLAQGVQRETPITPKANVTYNLTPDNMLYATAAKGYRVGGGNASFAGNPVCQIDFRTLGIPDAPSTYKSDSVWSYEVGTKNRLFNGMTELSASVFRVNWSNIQSLIFLPTCGNIYTDNLGAAVSQGGDIELETRVVEGLTWHVSIGYTDAHYSETKVMGGTSQKSPSATVALAGEPLPIPRVSGSTSLDFTHALFNSGHIGYMNLTYDYTGHYQLNPSAGVFGADPNTSDASEVRSLSARAGVRIDGLDLSVFANNLTNSRDITLRYHETVASTLYREQSLRPRTLGVTITHGF